MVLVGLIKRIKSMVLVRAYKEDKEYGLSKGLQRG